MTYTMVTLNGTTNGSGAATVDSDFPVTGEVVYVEVEGAALTDGADLVLSALLTEVAGTTEVSAEQIINHADIGNAAIDKLYPYRLAQDNTGSTLAVATGVNVAVRYFVAAAKLRAVVASGGDTKAFRVRVFLA